DENRANTLETEDKKLTGRVVPPILGRDAKVAALQDLAQKLDISEADVLAVGDGANDLGMLERAGLGVALHAKPSVQAACETRVNFGDLRALLYLQGYAETDFVQVRSSGAGRT
ncbi:MAG: HAD family phosphatase, partial [Pseudomonadota bacterium]